MGLVSLLSLLLPISCKAAEPDEFPWLVVALRALMGVCEVILYTIVNIIYPCRIIQTVNIDNS